METSKKEVSLSPLNTVFKPDVIPRFTLIEVRILKIQLKSSDIIVPGLPTSPIYL